MCEASRADPRETPKERPIRIVQPLTRFRKPPQRELKISPAEFDEVAAELGRTLDFFKVPEREKGEVLAAFAAHKGEVNEGYSE